MAKDGLGPLILAAVALDILVIHGPGNLRLQIHHRRQESPPYPRYSLNLLLVPFSKFFIDRSLSRSGLRFAFLQTGIISQVESGPF